MAWWFPHKEGCLWIVVLGGLGISGRMERDVRECENLTIF